MNAAALLHLLQFASPALPIGGYSYSQGLETAIERGLVVDAASAQAWIADGLAQTMACWDGPLLWRMMQAAGAGDERALAVWSERYLASRDCAEPRAESIQMGYSLTRLLAELALRAPPPAGTDVVLPTAFARAVHALQIGHQEALLAYLFAWTENQVLVCVKSVPLGQVAGQRILLALAPQVSAAADTARALVDDDVSSWAPGLSLLAMGHEVQHGRLYRS